jgi:SHS2 domain-containing protein
MIGDARAAEGPKGSAVSLTASHGYRQLLDADGVVPVAARFEEQPDGSIAGFVDVVPVDDVEEVEAAPKGVSRSELQFGEHGGVWRCHVVVDV